MQKTTISLDLDRSAQLPGNSRTGKRVGSKTPAGSVSWLAKCALASVFPMLVACGGSSSDDAAANSAALQGTWALDTCEVEDEDSSSRGELSFSGDSLTQTLVMYVGNQNCEGEVTISTSLLATFVVSGETQALPDGVAKHIDIFYSKAVVSASDAMQAVLESTGTTLQDSLTAEGIEDINNVPVTAYRDRETAYSIYQIMGNELRIGLNDASVNDGSTPEMRTDRLGPDVLIKQ